ncbi:putative membrane protein YgcG [Elusimicrobium posterum]|uniref:DUF2207 domain-containing protein n=1 Tax=Elusimicrobium posterum TaxID=3116653 RepID=UPI003C762B1F
MKIKNIITALLIALFPLTIQAREEIISFDSNITVNQNAGALITETIVVNAEHTDIRRGIIRDLPLKYKDSFFLDGGIKYSVKSLKMDGVTHPFTTEKEGDYLAVYFGDDNFLTRGAHIYELTYEIDNAVSFYKENDELYWNVTGDNWMFPIKSASVRVHLPQGAKVIEKDISTYTSRYGSKANDAVKLSYLQYAVQRTLSPGEGFTIAIPFEKGAVTEPSKSERFLMLLKNSTRFFAALALIVLVIIFIKISIGKIKSQYQNKVISPIFEPPAGISAGYASYLYQRKTTLNIVTVLLTSLTVKGAVTIEDNRTIKLKNKNAPGLSNEEEQALTYMFNTGAESFEIKSTNGGKIENIKSYANSLFKKLEGGNIFYNIPKEFTIPPFIAFLVFLYLLMPSPALIICFALSTLAAFLYGFRNGAAVVICFGFSFFLLMFAAPYGPQVLLIPVYLLICAVMFMSLPRYSLEGEDIIWQINCFRKYLEVGEVDRVKQSDPRKEAQIYCDYLPYAMALGMEVIWARQFKSVLESAEAVEVLQSRGFSSVYIANSMRKHSGIRNTIRSSYSAYNQAKYGGSSSSRRGSSSGGWSSGRGGGGRGSSGGGRGGGGGRGR